MRMWESRPAGTSSVKHLTSQMGSRSRWRRRGSPSGGDLCYQNFGHSRGGREGFGPARTRTDHDETAFPSVRRAKLYDVHLPNLRDPLGNLRWPGAGRTALPGHVGLVRQARSTTSSYRPPPILVHECYHFVRGPEV